ncbi:MAG: cytochrome P460 family protein [Pseudomonadota bacterium]
MMRRLAATTALFAAIATTPLMATEDRILDFPEGYKENFTLYFTGDRLLEEEQTIKIYANDVALSGMQKDGKLPDGSVLVAELYAAMKDSDGEVIESQIARRVPGDFKAIALMERRDGWDDQYPDELKVGNWEFEVFSTSGENLGKDTTGCRECHHPLTDTEFMFSIEHLAAVK